MIELHAGLCEAYQEWRVLLGTFLCGYRLGPRPT